MDLEKITDSLKENIHLLEWDIGLIQNSVYRQIKEKELNGYRRQLNQLMAAQKEVKNEI